MWIVGAWMSHALWKSCALLRPCDAYLKHFIPSCIFFTILPHTLFSWRKIFFQYLFPSLFYQPSIKSCMFYVMFILCQACSLLLPVFQCFLLPSWNVAGYICFVALNFVLLFNLYMWDIIFVVCNICIAWLILSFIKQTLTNFIRLFS